MSLSGKVALITGSPKGIGKAIPLALAREGVNVPINHKQKGALDGKKEKPSRKDQGSISTFSQQGSMQESS
jgi:NAD(P)-dependent dehydrogenase (short-subunit alcohol dehydrogenase family)